MHQRFVLLIALTVHCNCSDAKTTSSPLLRAFFRDSDILQNILFRLISGSRVGGRGRRGGTDTMSGLRYDQHPHASWPFSRQLLRVTHSSSPRFHPPVALHGRAAVFKLLHLLHLHSCSLSFILFSFWQHVQVYNHLLWFGFGRFWFCLEQTKLQTKIWSLFLTHLGDKISLCVLI